MTNTAVSYARVSKLKTDSGTSRSVPEQLVENRRTAVANDLDIRLEITDTESASRYATKDRPGYIKLIKVLRRGDTLIVWEASRASRKMEDHLELRNLCQQRGILFCAGGTTYDFTKSADRFSAGIQAQVNEYASDQTSERVLRNVRSRAEAGQPHSRMPYGYRREFDPTDGTPKWVIDPEQGAIIRELVDRLLADEKMSAILKDLNRRRVLAPRRSPEKDPQADWALSKTKLMLLRPTYAGLRTLQGKVIGVGNWPALMTEDEHDRLRTILTDPTRWKTTRGPAPRRLLTGIAVCYSCGRPVRFVNDSKSGPARYQCPKGCVGRRADKVDAMVESALVGFFADEIASRRVIYGDDDLAREAAAEARTLRQRLDVLRGQYADGKTSIETLLSVEGALTPKIEAAEAKVAAALTSPLMQKFAGADARTVWDDLTTQERREVVRTCLEVVIIPTRVAQGCHTRVFDPESVQITPRKWPG